MICDRRERFSHMGQKIKMWSNKKIGYMDIDSFGTQISKHEEYNLKLIM